MQELYICVHIYVQYILCAYMHAGPYIYIHMCRVNLDPAFELLRACARGSHACRATSCSAACYVALNLNSNSYIVRSCMHACISITLRAYACLHVPYMSIIITLLCMCGPHSLIIFYKIIVIKKIILYMLPWILHVWCLYRTLAIEFHIIINII